MLTLTVTYTRSNTNLPFFQPTEVEPTWKALLETYKTAGKLISLETRLGGELVAEQTPFNREPVMEIKSVWRSVADNMEFLGEEAVSTVRDARLAYCVANDIKVEYTRQVVVDEFDTEAPTA